MGSANGEEGVGIHAFSAHKVPTRPGIPGTDDVVLRGPPIAGPSTVVLCLLPSAASAPLDHSHYIRVQSRRELAPR